MSKGPINMWDINSYRVSIKQCRWTCESHYICCAPLDPRFLQTLN